jgi:HSP20 family protein
MASLIRWDPFGDVRGLRERMDRVFEDFFRGSHLMPWEGADLGSPLDVYETEDSLVVKAALPGVKPEEVDISVTGDILTIKGETKSEEAKPKTIKVNARPVIEGKS